jgi:CDP-glycerol glycerophosphotransferase (TagB/SpsB family)
LYQLIKIWKYLLRFTCVCLVTLIPKRKSIWVFGAWFGKSFSDNPKYLYQYLESLSPKEVTPVWIAKDLAVVLELKKQGVNAHHHNSLKGVFYQMIAKVAFVTHAISSDLSPSFIGLNTKRVQLWHGVPLKKIGFDDLLFTTKNTLAIKYPKLYSILLNDKFDLVISTGSKCSELFSSAFNEPKEKIVSTGFPRNDVFLFPAKEKPLGSPYKVIYMPTFRGGVGDEFNLFELFGFNFDKIEKVFGNENIELHIRTHPANCPPSSFLSKLKGSKQIKISIVSDIYEEINSYDCLVTDYSSIMFDFAISQKPILFVPFDLNEYLKADRELYCPYYVISGGNISKSWPELIGEIVEIKNNPCKYSNSNEFIRSFHDDINLDRNSFSYNVYSEVNKLL